LVVNRVPPLAGQESEPVLRNRGPGELEDLPRDRDQQRGGRRGRGRGQGVDRYVADTVAEPPAKRENRRLSDRGHCRATLPLSRLFPARFTGSSPLRSNVSAHGASQRFDATDVNRGEGVNRRV